MGDLWIYGVYLVEDGGDLVECATCPCAGGTITCTNCEDNTGPQEFDVTLPALTNDGCSDCADYSGTYRLSNMGGYFPCNWKYTFASATCGTVAENLYVFVSYNDPLSSKYSIEVRLAWTYGGGFPYMRWVKDYDTDKPDCDTLSGVSIPYYGVSGTCPCSTSSACTISAV